MLNLYRDTIEAFLKVPHIDENIFVNERGTTVFGNMHLKTYNPLLGESRPTFNEV